ncbi:hypothetical protein GCM10027405_14920 [Arthrobacter alkaliphilus]|nr:hypothetical protein [Arthrobacter alkaliphilus]
MRRVQRGDPSGAPRFQLTQPLAVDDGDVGDAVSLGPFEDAVQPLELEVGPGYYNLSAFVVGDVVLGGVFGQQIDCAAAEPGLGRAGFVVEPGVDDAGVVAGLVSWKSRKA